MNTDTQTTESIRAQFVELQKQGMRARNIADTLKISEGELAAAFCGEHTHAPQAVPLQKDWMSLLKALEPCGKLMALTRNNSTVHEKTGIYRKLSGTNQMGLALDKDIDLRLFLSRWHAGFAVKGLAANASNQDNYSLQFFDAQGQAVHKIYPRKETNFVAWERVIQDFRNDEVESDFSAIKEPEDYVDEPEDAAAFLSDWGGMQDTHEFFGLLKKHKLERQHGFRIAEGSYTQRLSADTLNALLTDVAANAVPIMCFVGNYGCIQIHTGPVQNIIKREMGGAMWLNVMDEGFNLHLRESDIDTVWAVEKPTEDGIVSSIEAFDTDGELMAMFFGARKPGQVELTSWRDLFVSLREAHAVCN